MITVKNVTKTFDSFTALDDLSLNVEKGSIYGLVGPNGSGKTTIMKAIAGIYKVDKGDISIAGKKSFCARISTSFIGEIFARFFPWKRFFTFIGLIFLFKPPPGSKSGRISLGFSSL